MNNAKSAATIKEQCKLKGISVAEILNKCSIRKSLMYDMEKRNYTPSVEVFEKIADYLECSVDYLLCRADEPAMTYNSLPQHDKAILSAYHSQPRLQPAVDKLLGIGSEEYNFSGMDLSHPQVAAFGGMQQAEGIDLEAVYKSISYSEKKQ